MIVNSFLVILLCMRYISQQLNIYLEIGIMNSTEYL